MAGLLVPQKDRRECPGWGRPPSSGGGAGLYNQQSLEVSGTRITGNWAVDGGRIYANGTEAMVTLHRLNLAALTLRVRVPWQVTST